MRLGPGPFTQLLAIVLFFGGIVLGSMVGTLIALQM